MNMRDDANTIMKTALAAVQPDSAVRRALEKHPIQGNCYIIAIGKAAYRMAEAATKMLQTKVKGGLILTKYGHGGKAISPLRQIEAGHPIPDENSLLGAQLALDIVRNLTQADTVIFLVSGGGSALFELPLNNITLQDIATITKQLLACGSDIVEINTIRKHLSAVKGGRFALACAPAHIFTIVLSDILGDPLDSIASGPTYPDVHTCAEALTILQKYQISVPERVQQALQIETPKSLENVQTEITGNVRALCDAAAHTAKMLGYTPLLLTTTLSCEAREAGSFLASIAAEVQASSQPLRPPCALIAGGETIVHLRGNGTGGRNQELALAMGIAIEGMQNTLAFSLGSDGTDGPTNAAGGIVDGQFAIHCRKKGLDAYAFLQNNDSHTLLHQMDALLITGPTGTNVNDLSVILMR